MEQAKNNGWDRSCPLDTSPNDESEEQEDQPEIAPGQCEYCATTTVARTTVEPSVSFLPQCEICKSANEATDDNI